MWTSFMDMHSGGRAKVCPYEFIYIEAAEKEAIAIFKDRFDRDPHNVTCECCGEDYRIDSNESLASLTAFRRGCQQEMRLPDGRVIRKADEYKKLSQAELDSLVEFTIEGHREGSFYAYTTLEEFSKREDVLIISKKEIK